MSALSTKGLTKAFGGILATDNLDLTVKQGSLHALIGPNGAGKTTLLRTLAGLQNPLEGHISGAEDQIAYAGHADGLKSMLSVSENLSFWAQVFGQADIAPALEAYALEPLADRLAGTLSAGQKRRLGLARLLVTGRPIWVLDEPTVSLDQNAVAQFAAAVQAHLASDGSALIATHIDLGLDAQVLDISAFRAKADTRAGASDEAFL